MPTVLIEIGFRFFFYSNDHLPVHIHIEKNDCIAKFNLSPIELVHSKRFSAKDLKKIRIIIEANKELLNNKWNEYFNS